MAKCYACEEEITGDAFKCVSCSRKMCHTCAIQNPHRLTKNAWTTDHFCATCWMPASSHSSEARSASDSRSASPVRKCKACKDYRAKTPADESFNWARCEDCKKVVCSDHFKDTEVRVPRNRKKVTKRLCMKCVEHQE